jgi:hypothetical protein
MTLSPAASRCSFSSAQSRLSNGGTASISASGISGATPATNRTIAPPVASETRGARAATQAPGLNHRLERLRAREKPQFEAVVHEGRHPAAVALKQVKKIFTQGKKNLCRTRGVVELVGQGVGGVTICPQKT